MPSFQDQLPDVSPKALLRRTGRSAAIWSANRASFMGFTLPKLQRAIRTLDTSLKELSSPITIIVGQGDKAQAVQVMDYAAQAKVSNALLAAIEQERQLLGFPSPGRRRDENSQAKCVNASPSIIDAEPAGTGANDPDNSASTNSVNHIDATG